MDNKKKKYIAIGVVVIVLIIATVLTCKKKDDTSKSASAQTSSVIDEPESKGTKDSKEDSSKNNDSNDSTTDNSTTNSSNIDESQTAMFTEEEWKAMTPEEQSKYIVDDGSDDYDANTLPTKYDSAYDSNGNKIKDILLPDDDYMYTVDISNTTPEWGNLTGAAVYVGNLVNNAGFFGRNSGDVTSIYDGWTVTSYENIASENSAYKNLYRLGAYTHIKQRQCLYNIYGTEKCYNNRNANNYIVAAYITVNDDGTAKLHRMYVSKFDTDEYTEYSQILADDGTFDAETIAYLDSGVGTVLK